MRYTEGLGTSFEEKEIEWMNNDDDDSDDYGDDDLSFCVSRMSFLCLVFLINCKDYKDRLDSEHWYA